MDYKQLFTQAMQRPDITEALAKAKELAGNITSYQKEQRTAPIIQALQQFADNYHAATTDEERQQANTMANQIRSNFLTGGGSGMDLPAQYWGSDPAKGFQTGRGFEVPVTGYEGLGREKTIDLKRQALIDALNTRLAEADLSGVDPSTGQKTWLRQYQEQDLATRLASGGGGGGSSGGGITPYQWYQIDRNEQQDRADIEKRARELATKDSRRWEGSEAQEQVLLELIDAYMAKKDPNTGKRYDYETAEKMARGDGRYLKPAEGYFTDNNLYEAYYNDLTRNRYDLPTGNPPEPLLAR